MIYVQFLLVLAASVVCAEPPSVICCLGRQFVTDGINSSYVCWEPILDITLPLRLKCENSLTPIDLSAYEFHVSNANILNLSDEYFSTEIPPDKFCLGNFTESINETGRSDAKLTAMVCGDEESPIVENDALAYCMIVSVVFLTITAIIYIILPEVRDLQGKSIINFCVSLALGLGCLAIMKLISEYSDMTLCAVRGFLTYYFLIVSFFWTNAISIQILRSMRRPFLVEYGWKEFGWYALYAWGSGSLLTIIMAIVNFHPGSHSKPGIGLNHCWFFDWKQQWYYMYSVMTILITANIIIFIYTSLLLWRQSFASTHVKALKYKFFMTLKLFIIMGIPWIFEMVSSLTERSIIWIILDFVNILVGPMLFIVLVVCRRRVVKALYKRGYLDCISDYIEKRLAVGDDEEENAIEHTMDVPMNEQTDINR